MPSSKKSRKSICPVRVRIEELIAAPGSPDPEAKVTTLKKERTHRPRKRDLRVVPLHAPCSAVQIGARAIYVKGPTTVEHHIHSLAPEIVSYLAAGLLNFVS